jgi:hypothetical protein
MIQAKFLQHSSCRMCGLNKLIVELNRAIFAGSIESSTRLPSRPLKPQPHYRILCVSRRSTVLEHFKYYFSNTVRKWNRLHPTQAEVSPLRKLHPTATARRRIFEHANVMRSLQLLRPDAVAYARHSRAVDNASDIHVQRMWVATEELRFRIRRFLTCSRERLKALACSKQQSISGKWGLG